MCGGVRGVIKLSEDHGSRDGLLQLFCLGDSSLHALGAFGQYQLCTVCLQEVTTLHTHGLGKGKNGSVTLSCSHTCQADTGVAGGGFDDGGAFF